MTVDSPIVLHPEILRLWTGVTESDFGRIVRQALPKADHRRILIKPNWVKHEENPSFPIAAMVTSTHLIVSAIEACLELYPDLEWITVGDVPLQTCDWDLLMKQSGMERVIEKYRGHPKVRICDLRRERYLTRNGYFEQDTSSDFGDPCGYREVLLDNESFLDPVSENSDSFRVSDYSPKETTSSHHRGFHRYLIAGSALEADLIVNLPKLKTHQKAGITAALKNLVGINGQKAYLVHYQRGKAGHGGDEFPANGSGLVLLQTRIRELVQKRSRILFRMLRPGWVMLKRIGGIQTEGTPENLSQKFYISSGAWYGNDTIWRMVYDLNHIIRYAPAAGGRLQSKPQRSLIAILDGVIAGEGNGPLQPLPVELGILITGSNPFQVDAAGALVMGFDPDTIPTTAHRREFTDADWSFEPDTVQLVIDGKTVQGMDNIPILHPFTAPPGWRGHVERSIGVPEGVVSR